MNKFLIAVRRFIFGWKTSDLIEHLINTGRYQPEESMLDSQPNVSRFMCCAIYKFLGDHRSGQTERHRKKIRDRIDQKATLSAYLVATNRLYPTTEESFNFWKDYIQELRAKGE